MKSNKIKHKRFKIACGRRSTLDPAGEAYNAPYTPWSGGEAVNPICPPRRPYRLSVPQNKFSTGSVTACLSVCRLFH